MPDVPRFEVSPEIGYQCHPDHRNGNPEKSQWCISASEEFAAFRLTLENNWMINETAWGLHISNGSIQYCGFDKTGTRNLIVAKFVSVLPANEWHGYPADPNGKSQIARNREIPPLPIQQSWMNTEFLSRANLTRAKIRKIGKGEPCNL